MIRQITGLVGYVLLFAALLFVPAGTFAWGRAWIFLAVLLVVRGVSTVRLWSRQRSLLEQRSRLPLQRGQPLTDRVLLIAFMATFAGLVSFVSWDRWHAQLLPPLPEWLRVMGLVAFASGWWIVHHALRANAYAVTVVRYQEERGHGLVDEGPYAIVRHPMYAGLVPILLGLSMWFGSSAGIIAALVPIGILAARIIFEERLLRGQIPEYSSYALRVRKRLIPGLW